MANVVRWRGNQVKWKTEKGMARNMRAAAFHLAESIRASFPASGATGSRAGGGNKGNPSAPGEIPHVQTGHLKRNIGVKRKEQLVYRVGTGIGNKDSVGYAQALEFGRADGRMAPRPFLRPALKKEKAKINKIAGRDVI